MSPVFSVNLSKFSPKILPHNKGVYEIYNLVRLTSYVGSSYTSVAWRIKNHLCLLKTSKHRNKQLQEDWDFYGIKSFEFRLLENLNDKKLVIKAEKKWILQKWKESQLLYNRYIPKESGYLPPDIELIRDSNRSAKINSNIARSIFSDYHINKIGVQEIMSRYNASKGIVDSVIKKRSWVHATQKISIP